MEIERSGKSNSMKDERGVDSVDKINNGKFIAFEGIDGSGKSTQVAMLAERLRGMGVACYTTMEPTDSPIGSLIHQIMTGRIKMDNRVIAALFAADRLDHLLNDVDGILEKVNDGITVITDRYCLSSYAYQSVDVPMDWVMAANEQSSKILRPTVTVFIDVSPDIALERIAKNRFHQELFEKKSRLIKVRENYERVFEKLGDEENIICIDGDRPQEIIAKDIWEKIKGYY